MGEYSTHKDAYEDYLWERLEKAYDAISSLGAGTSGMAMTTYRLIEAEWLTRQRSEVIEINEWLSLELIPSEIFLSNDEIAEVVLEACDEVADRFDWAHGPATRVTLLTLSANTPWAPGRHGFCIDKYPFDKVCIPSALTNQKHLLKQVVLHEYAHVMTMNRSNGLCPLWLDEAVAMTAGGQIDPKARWEFQVGHWPWRDPMDLSRAFHQDRESHAGQQVVWQAYQQSAVLGAYLASLKGEESLGRLMYAYTNNAWIVNLLIRLKGEEPSEEALNEVYGFGVDELFKRSHDWLLSEESDDHA